MKLFLSIFSLYFLALSCLPCGDMDDCKYDTKMDVNTHTEHSNHDEDAENCSPFCLCSCCGQSLIFPIISLIQAPALLTSLKEVPGYEASLVTEFSISIWQPPKHC